MSDSTNHASSEQMHEVIFMHKICFMHSGFYRVISGNLSESGRKRPRSQRQERRIQKQKSPLARGLRAFCCGSGGVDEREEDLGKTGLYRRPW